MMRKTAGAGNGGVSSFRFRVSCRGTVARRALLILILILPFVLSLAEAPAAPHPLPLSTPASCVVSVMFSPAGGIAAAIAGEVGTAKTRIRMAMYGFTNPALATALIAAKKRGVDVALKFDKTQSAGAAQTRQLARLRAAKVKLAVSPLERTLHDKFAVIDGRATLTGSYNWTLSAERANRENWILIDCPEVAAEYEKEWALIE